MEKPWRSPIRNGGVIFLLVLLVIFSGYKLSPEIFWCSRQFKLPDRNPVRYDVIDVFIYGAWLIGPPVFFLYEYVFLFGKDPARRMDPKQVEDLKYCQELATKIWAGIGVFLSALLLIKYGIKL